VRSQKKHCQAIMHGQASTSAEPGNSARKSASTPAASFAALLHGSKIRATAAAGRPARRFRQHPLGTLAQTVQKHKPGGRRLACSWAWEKRYIVSAKLARSATLLDIVARMRPATGHFIQGVHEF
jgi:hypothetical protein